MVWCIHENLDSSDEETSDIPAASSVSPSRSPFSKLAQLQQRHSVEDRYLLPGSHRQYQTDIAHSPPRSKAVLQRNRSIPARMTPALSPLHRSVVDIGASGGGGSGSQSARINQRRKGTLSLDSQRTLQQSSFESSGSSRMNSFDSTGTHNEHL